MDILARNGRTREGKVLYNERTPEGEKYQIITTHLANTLMPTTQPFQRTVKAITGEPGRTGEIYEIVPELAGIFGMRPIKIDPKKSLGYYLYKFQTDQSADRRNFTGGKFGVLSGRRKTPQDVIERFFIANKQLFETQREMKQILNAAQTLGVSEDELYDVFEERGLSTKSLARLLDGEFKPFEPGKNIIRRFEKIAEDTGVPNPYDTAEPVINKIIDDLYNQNLNERFELQLENYLPQKQNMQQSSMTPLPNTPMPMPGNFKPPVDKIMMSGLTQMEEVYLSPEEKLIRKRSRGIG